MKSLLVASVFLGFSVLAAPITKPEELDRLKLFCKSQQKAVYLLDQFHADATCTVKRIIDGKSEASAPAKCYFPVSRNHYSFYSQVAGHGGAEMYGSLDFVETTSTYDGWFQFPSAAGQDWPKDSVTCVEFK